MMTPPPEVIVDVSTKTVRPVCPEGDLHYGLKVGTNGTGTTMRRVLAAPEGFTWVCSDGRHALGTTLVPSRDNSFRNPWS